MRPVGHPARSDPSLADGVHPNSQADQKKRPHSIPSKLEDSCGLQKEQYAQSDQNHGCRGNLRLLGCRRSLRWLQGLTSG